MLEFLHQAIDWMGSTLLFLILSLAWLFIFALIGDEVLSLFIPDKKQDPKKKSQEDIQDEDLL